MNHRQSSIVLLLKDWDKMMKEDDSGSIHSWAENLRFSSSFKLGDEDVRI